MNKLAVVSHCHRARPNRVVRFLAAVIVLGTCLCWLSACNKAPSPNEDQEIRQKSAEAARNVKEGADKAEAAAKQATDTAERKLSDVAQGVKQGLSGTDSSGRLDVNTASESSLVTLPGITTDKARKIIERRPYNSTHDLVAKGLVSESEFERISSKITAK